MPTETETETETLTLSDGRLARLREAKGRDLIAATRLTDDTNALALALAAGSLLTLLGPLAALVSPIGLAVASVGGETPVSEGARLQVAAPDRLFTADVLSRY